MTVSIAKTDFGFPNRQRGEVCGFDRLYPSFWIGRDEGLGSSQVHQVALSNDGRVWAVSPSGLVCYDGMRVTTYGRREGLACHGLRALAIDDDNTLWIGSDEGVQSFDIDAAIIRPRDWFPIGMVDVIAARNGLVLVGTPSGLHVGRNGDAIVPCVEPLVSGALISDVWIDDDGTSYVLGAKIGLLVGGASAWRQLLECGTQTTGILRRIQQYDRHSLIVGGDRGLALLSDAGEVLAEIGTQAPVDAVHCHGGEVYAAIGDALVVYRLHAGSFERIGTPVGLKRINGMCSDAFDNLWLASENSGVGRLSGLRNSLAYPQIPLSGPILCVKNCTSGLAFGGTEGLFYAGRVQVPGTKVWDVHEDPDGALWIASDQGLYRAQAPHEPELVSESSDVCAAPCRVIAPFRDGILVGSTRGLALVHKDGIDELLSADGNGIGYVYSLLVEPSGKVWICSLGSGLWVYENDEVRRACRDLGRNCNVYAVTQDADGVAYVAHDNSISRLSPDGDFRTLYESSESIAAWSVLCTSDGHLYLGTTRGLVEIDRQTGEEVFCLVDRSNGASWEFTTSRSLYATPDAQKLVCGISSGVAEVVPADLVAFHQRPRAKLHRVVWVGVEPDQFDDGFRVEAGKWRAHFHLRTGWFVDERDCELRYRMLGFDEDWSAYSAYKDISYNSLPPGSYTLEVQMRSRLVGEGEVVHLCAVDVTRPTGLVGAGLRMALPSIFSFRERIERQKRRRLRNKSIELEQRIHQRTLDLVQANHEMREARDQLEQLANVDPLTEIANRRQFEATLEEAVEAAQSSDGALSLVLIDVDHFKRFNDTYGHPVGDEALIAIARAMKSVLRSSVDLVARIGGEEFALILPNIDKNDGLRLAQRLVEGVQAMAVPHSTSPTSDFLTVSAGLASLDLAIADKRQLVLLADEALYDAKLNGRNQVAFRETAKLAKH